MAYTYAASYLQVTKEYQRKDPVRPVILGETGYEDEPNAIERLPDAKEGRSLDILTAFAVMPTGRCYRVLAATAPEPVCGVSRPTGGMS